MIIILYTNHKFQCFKYLMAQEQQLFDGTVEDVQVHEAVQQRAGHPEALLAEHGGLQH